jgi:hypothetical protein
MKEKYIKHIDNLGYRIDSTENHGFRIHHDSMLFNIILDKKEDDFYDIGFTYKHYSIDEVTDSNEIYTFIFILILRSLNVASFRIVLFLNDIVCDDEIDFIYFSPAQPLSEKLRVNIDADFDILIEILDCLVFFHAHRGDFTGYNAGKPSQYLYDSKNLEEWTSKILPFVNDGYSSIAREKINPDWLYFRSTEAGLSIYKCPPIIRIIKVFHSQGSDKTKTIDGPTATLFDSKNIKNVVSFDNARLAKSLLLILDNTTDILILAQENFTSFIGTDNIVTLQNDGTLNNYFDQSEKIFERQRNEIQFLGTSRKIIWNIENRNDSAIFEDLVQELLYREPNIKSAHKLGPAFQPDGGRDLLVEYIVPTNTGNEDAPQELKTMIVQCKTKLKSTKSQTIGMNAVTHVPHLLTVHKPDAYRLIVNTQITVGLTDYLIALKGEGKTSIDYWQSFQLDERLRLNPDILNRYSSIVTLAPIYT